MDAAVLYRPRAPRPPPELPPERPREQEEWYQRLPEALRTEFAEHERARLAGYAEMAVAKHRRGARETLQTAGIFAIADLACTGSSLATLLLAASIGGAVGLLCNRLDAYRLLSATIGMSAFMFFECASRSGLSARQMLMFFPLGCACAYLGWLREEREGP